MFACILLFTLGDAYRASFKSQEHFDDLSVKLWTWNSGKAELSQEADRLEADKGSDVLVTCQTEATVAIKKFMKDSEWHLLAHGEHWGAAGGRLNAQMASIFVRRRLETSGNSLRNSMKFLRKLFETHRNSSKFSKSHDFRGVKALSSLAMCLS